MRQDKSIDLTPEEDAELDEEEMAEHADFYKSQREKLERILKREKAEQDYKEKSRQLFEDDDGSQLFYTPSQPRDAHGRWVNTGGGTSSSSSSTGGGGGGGGTTPSSPDHGVPSAIRNMIRANLPQPPAGPAPGHTGHTNSTTSRASLHPRGTVSKEQAKSHAEDPALIRDHLGKWIGEDAYMPPFTVQQFERSMRNWKLVPNQGINETHIAKIAGEQYAVKRVTDDTAMKHVVHGITYHDIPEVFYPARYETHAEMANWEIAQHMGYEEHFVPTWAFDHKGDQYVVTKWQHNEVDLYDPGVQADLSNHFSPEFFHTMMFHEYVMGNVDRNRGNYLTKPDYSQFHLIDSSRSMRSWARHNGYTPMQRTFLEHYPPQNPRRFLTPEHMRTAPLDKAIIQKFLDAEPEILNIIDNHGLYTGETGVMDRLDVLRNLVQNYASPNFWDWHQEGNF